MMPQKDIWLMFLALIYFKEVYGSAPRDLSVLKSLKLLSHEENIETAKFLAFSCQMHTTSIISLWSHCKTASNPETATAKTHPPSFLKFITFNL